MAHIYNKKPYLLHRMSLEDTKADCLSAAFDFDYMGSTEFEVGTLWKTLASHKDSKWVNGSVTLKGTTGNVRVRFLYPEENYDRSNVISIIEALWLNEIHLKECSRFSAEYHAKTSRFQMDTWVDIQSGLFFTWTSLTAERLKAMIDGSIAAYLNAQKPRTQITSQPVRADTAADMAGASLRERMIASGQLRVRQ